MPSINAYRLRHFGAIYAKESTATVPFAEILSQAGIDPSILTAADARVELQREANVVERSCLALKDKTFAARAGLAANGAGTLSTYLTRASNTVGEALALVQRYYALEDRDAEFEAAQGRDGPVITLSSGVLAPHIFPRHREFLLFGLFKRLQQVAGPEFWPLSLQVESRDEEQCQRLREIAGCDIRGNQSAYAVILPENGFSFPIPTSDQVLLSHLRSHAEERLRAHPDTTPTLAERVTALVRSQLPGRVPGGDEVADALGMTRRTLTRRLAAEGTGYKALVEVARCDMAKRLILGGESLAQVAFLLDFADQAIFSVAFKRWTGESPARFRKSHL